MIVEGKGFGNPISMQNARTHSSTGAVFLELALAFPLILLLIVGITDIGNVFVDLLEISQIANEAARLGSRTLLLDPGSACLDQSGINCCPITSETCLERPSHIQMGMRVNGLMPSAGPRASTWTTNTTYTGKNSSGTAPIDDNTVKVTISVNCRTILSGFMGSTVRVRATAIAPYLY